MKIAVIGSGISGLGAAYLLDAAHEVCVYEKQATLGGHSRTVDVSTADGRIAVDTGFIVFNNRNYPLLTGLFAKLDVPVIASDMSFGASIDGGWLEYGTQSLSNVFAQKRNLLRPTFWRMIRDILRFNKQAKHYIDADPSVSLGECLELLGMGAWFRDYYLLAMGGAIWSTPLQQMLDFPASSFIRFFDNHGLLTVNDQPQWYTVRGGSREYVKRLSGSLRATIRTRCAVMRVERTEQGVMVSDESGDAQLYDRVVFACHADQALMLLVNPSADEARLLGACRYQPNQMILHSDTSFMPKRQAAWASWVYLAEGREDHKPQIALSYWMNRLQSLPSQTPIIVTLNPTRAPNAALVHDRCEFSHPLFDAAAIQAQAEMDVIQGVDRIFYCGAWQRYGFHEDGLHSAVAVANKMGIAPSWM